MVKREPEPGAKQCREARGDGCHQHQTERKPPPSPQETRLIGQRIQTKRTALNSVAHAKPT